MHRHIRVIVFKRSTRKIFEAQWTDPETGRKCTRSTGKQLRRDAERWAGQLEKQLNSGAPIDAHKNTWEHVVSRYRKEYLSGLGETTAQKSEATLKRIEKDLRPRMISSLNEDRASTLAGILRDEGLSEATIKGHLAEMRKLLRWCFDLRMIERLPKLRIPKKTDKMKGRPISDAEFEAMLAAVPAVIPKATTGDKAVATIESWRFLLRGLWWSGLRLGEAMVLQWNDCSKIGLDLSGRHPMFVIDSGTDKARQDRVFPVAPEFAEILLSIPKDQRRGFVFNPIPLSSYHIDRLLPGWVSRTITAIGTAAGVKVAEPDGRVRHRRKPENHLDGDGKPLPPEPLVKFASAHDLRRAFGVRWSQRVLPPVLKEMMRHESLATTMNFYVGRNAEAAAQTIHDAYRRQNLSGANKIADTPAADISTPQKSA